MFEKIPDDVLSRCLRFLVRFDGITNLPLVSKQFLRTCSNLTMTEGWAPLVLVTFSRLNQVAMFSLLGTMITRFKPQTPIKRASGYRKRRRRQSETWPTCIAVHKSLVFVCQYRQGAVVIMRWKTQKQRFAYVSQIKWSGIKCPEGIHVSEDGKKLWVACAYYGRLTHFVLDEGNQRNLKYIPMWHCDLPDDLFPWNLCVKWDTVYASVHGPDPPELERDYQLRSACNTGRILEVKLLKLKGKRKDKSLAEDQSMATEAEKGPEGKRICECNNELRSQELRIRGEQEELTLNRPSGICFIGNTLYVTSFDMRYLLNEC